MNVHNFCLCKSTGEVITRHLKVCPLSRAFVRPPLVNLFMFCLYSYLCIYLFFLVLFVLITLLTRVEKHCFSWLSFAKVRIFNLPEELKLCAYQEHYSELHQNNVLLISTLIQGWESAG